MTNKELLQLILKKLDDQDKQIEMIRLGMAEGLNAADWSNSSDCFKEWVVQYCEPQKQDSLNNPFTLNK